MDVSDCGYGELAPLGALIGILGQSGDAVSLEAAVQTGARELWASSARVKTVLWGDVGPIGASSVVVLARHLVTVVRLKP